MISQNQMQNLKKLLLVGLLAVSLSPVALAAPTSEECFSNPSQAGCGSTITTASGFYDVLEKIFNFGAAALVLVASFFILVAGFNYVTSHGDEEKIGKAKTSIVYAIIGLVVAGLAWGIPQVIKATILN